MFPSVVANVRTLVVGFRCSPRVVNQSVPSTFDLVVVVAVPFLVPMSAAAGLDITLEFSGGAELLFGNVKKHRVSLFDSDMRTLLSLDL